jgi:spore coat protein CotH
MDETSHRLTIGDVQYSGLYDETEIREIDLTFEQADFWQQLEDNYNPAIAISATITVDGVVYPNVGVRYKGQTSYMQNDTDKKSFNVTMDEYDSGNDLMGYESLNFACGFFDPTWLREFLFQRLIRKHIPAAASCFIKLSINGEDWGIYTNVQQTNSEFLAEWFMDSSGARWRADSPAGTGGPGGGGPGGGGPGGGGGPNWGDGTAALNFLGSESADYEEYYTLKMSDLENPWEVLINTCDVLENTPLNNLYAELNQVMDVDRALWFLACENLFADDDGYIHKGKMDYHVFYEEETGKMVPLEYDGNTVMMNQHLEWSPFYNSDDENYPLLYRLLQIDEVRQRYLAHYRTILEEFLNPAVSVPLINEWSAFIDSDVENDPHSIYPYGQFMNETNVLIDAFEDRYVFLSNAPEINVESPIIANVEMMSSEGGWTNPLANTSAWVTANASHSEGIEEVNLFYSYSVNGDFTKVTMEENDDLSFTALIPAAEAGTLVRFYLEAVSSNSVNTRVYMPSGAEHDTYFYTVDPVVVDVPQISINELMAINDETVADEAGEYDDWVELYNFTDASVDISGWHLSDNPWNLSKWTFPEGTTIEADGYLIVWADEDSSEGGLHTNFKLSGSGESVFLTTIDGAIVDDVDFPAQTADLAYARIPNGTGEFIIQPPTFAGNNEHVGIDESDNNSSVLIYPNPTHSELNILLNNFSSAQSMSLVSTSGRVIFRQDVATPLTSFDVSSLSPGIYLVVVNSGENVITKRVVVE